MESITRPAIPPVIISIEGNIGSGKSTLIRRLKDTLSGKAYAGWNVLFLQEPVEEWIQLTDREGMNILDVFYRDMPRWSFTFQLNAFITRIQAIERAIQGESADPRPLIVIMERSVYTDREVFAANLYKEGKMSDIEWTLYTKWFDWIRTLYASYMPSSYIYLQSCPQVSFDRMKRRGREEESGVTLGYLSSVHQAHEDWLTHRTDSMNATVTRIPYDIESSDTSYEMVYQKILHTILDDISL